MSGAKGAGIKNKAVRRAAYVGVLAALGFGLSWLEMLLPSIGIPGAKLGVANLAVLAALYLCSPAEAALVSLVRIILSWLLFGSLTGLIYSLCGGALSLAVMVILKKCNRFSPVGVSAAGGVFHNIGQLAAAYVMMGRGVLGYLPALLLFGAVFGTVTGIIAKLIIERLDKVR